MIHRAPDGVLTPHIPPIGEVVYVVKNGGNRARVTAHTAFEAWAKSRLPGSPAYSQCTVLRAPKRKAKK